MKFQHDKDETYVIMDLILKAVKGEELDVNSLACEYNYTIYSIYRLIRKVNQNLEIMHEDFRLIKIAPSKFKAIKISEQN